ncbi:MAG: glycosyltransferase family 2 protein [Actinomycetota bacterium]|nr:glycosyltransferase family 2 protein [Actinomycetota bacterium]
MKLSVLVPVYNEAATVSSAIARILAVSYPCDVEVVIVNDGSTDGTKGLLDAVDDPRVRVFHQAVNKGKGAAIKTASTAATGDYFIICDADLEYAPEEIPSLLVPVLGGEASVVYGTRSFGSHTAYSFWYVLGNKAVTMATNVLFDCWLSDIETCFKLIPADVYRSLDIRSHGFGMEAEVTAKLLNTGVRPYEVPISYRARSREEGKKLTWRDGVEALWILTRERIRGDRRKARAC